MKDESSEGTEKTSSASMKTRQQSAAQAVTRYKLIQTTLKLDYEGQAVGVG